MRNAVDVTLLANNRVIQRFFQSGKWEHELEQLLIVSARKFHSSSGTPLDGLVSQEAARKEKARENSLQKLFYNIDAPESLNMICTSPRFEAVSDPPFIVLVCTSPHHNAS